MRAAVLRSGEIIVRDDVPEPKPAQGQVLVQVKACGICGSDLHFARHGATMLKLQRESGAAGPGIDLDRDVFMGHEFSAEILEVGPDTQAPAPGTIVTSIPVLFGPTGVHALVYTNDVPAGYGERMLLSAPMLQKVPNGLDPRHAALTEPMAVGLHAVNKSDIAPGNGAIVLGCGPVGLAVIAALRLRGIEPIVAADFSTKRREIAEQMGAHEVVDPSSRTAFEAWRNLGGSKQPVVFEAIGVPGIINMALRDAPARSKIVVVGACMEPDTITPMYGIGKELSIQFCFGYDPGEFAGTLHAIAEGELDVVPMITGEVGVDGVPGAFDELGSPDRHCKILVVP